MGARPSGDAEAKERIEAPRQPVPSVARPPFAGKGPALPAAMTMPLPMAAYGLPTPYQRLPAGYPMGMPYQYDGMPGFPMQYPSYPMPAFFVMPQMPPGAAPFLAGPAMAPAVPLSPADRQQLKTQVQAQIEYYFGKDNLIKDIHLRTNCMNSEGWVPIAVLAGFRRIQNMTTDISIIHEALQGISMLEVDPTGVHIRVKDTWQNWILDPSAVASASVGSADGSPAKTG